MLLVTVLAQAAAASAPAAALPAPQAQPAAPPAQVQGQTEGVVSYPLSFFTALNSANAYDMVEHLPGFTLDTGASVRGFEGAAGNVLIDGQRPSSKSDAIDQILQRIPASQVERIDVIRGGAPGIDMQGKTVIANVVRKKGGGLRGLMAVAGGYVVDDGRFAPSFRVEGSGGTNGRAWEASVRRGRGIDDGAGPGPEVRVDPQGNILSQNAIDAHAGGWQTTGAGSFETPLAGGQFRVNGRYYTNTYDSYETDTFSRPAGQVFKDHYSEDETDTELGLRYLRPFGTRLNLELVGLRTTKDFVQGDVFAAPPGATDAFKLDRYSTETIGRGVLKFRQTPKLSWEAGGEAAYNDLDSQTSLKEDERPILLPSANVKVEEKRWEVFGKGVWQPLETLTVEGGVRQEGSRITARGDLALGKSLYFTKPRAVVTWNPTPAYQLRVRVEREVGQLNFDDFVAKSTFNTSTVTAGNPDLNPEQAWVAEAALEYRFWGSGSVAVTATHYELKDAIDRAPIFNKDGSFFDAPANIGSGTKDEYRVEVTLPLDKAGLRGAQLKGFVIRRDTEVTDPTTHRKREISGLKPLEWEAHFSQPIPSWNANWGVDAFGAWRKPYYRADVVENVKLKTYVTVFYEWKPRPDIQIHAEIQNATERGLRDTRSVFQGARSAGRLGYVDDRDQQFGRIAYVRIRKYFGG